MAGSQREIDPQQMGVSVHTEPCNQIVEEHRRCGGEREPGPRPPLRSVLARDDSGGHDPDREQRGEIGGRLDHEGVQPGVVRDRGSPPSPRGA